MIRRFMSTRRTKFITLVKKVDSNGNDCKKCKQVVTLLNKEGIMDDIDKVETIVEGDSNSMGNLLAQKYKIKNAPFFVVKENEETRVYPYYTQFKKNEVKVEVSDKEQVTDMFDKNFSNDYL